MGDRTPEQGPAEPGGLECIVFSLSGQGLAFPLRSAREVLPPLPYTRLPGCGPEVLGLIGVRSRAVTVFDLGLALGLHSSNTLPDSRVLLMERGDRLVGFAVDQVIAVARGVLRPEKSAGETAPPGLAGDLLLGSASLAGLTCLVLDVDALAARLLA